MMKKTNPLSDRHERDIAAILPDGVRTIASGAKYDRHDVKSIQTEANNYWRQRLELKCTQKKSYRFIAQEWLNLFEYTYSRGSDERPGWAIRFYAEDDGRLEPPILADLAVIDMNDYVELLTELYSLRDHRCGDQTE
jgi:hypothetical protein